VKTYDLYGTRALGLDELRAAVEQVLGLTFERHESDYLGGDYFLAGDHGDEQVVLLRNHSAEGNEDEVREPEFADFAVLLEINATTRGDELRGRLQAVGDLDFLRRSVP
jgi:hypothetical protein